MTRVQAGRRWPGLRPARGGLRGGLLASFALAGTLAGSSAGSIGGCASQQKKQAPVVRDLRIEGNQQISSRQIQKKILTAKTGWWPFASKQYFDPVSWEADLRRIVRLYETRGYYQARIAHEAAVPQPKGVALEVKIDEGNVTRVGTLEVRGLEALPAADREAALVKMPLQVGAPFEESDWEAAKGGIIPRLHDRGYAKATAEGEALVDVTTHLAAVTIVVHPGLRYHFGAIDVKTPPVTHVPAVFVWEQARLAIPEGGLYSDDALVEAERRIFGMGVFGSVNVSVGPANDATAVLPVVVTVREAPFRTLRLGAGVVIDQIHEEARLIGDWTHRNFLGGTRKLTIHAEAGWAFLPNIYAVATNDVSVAPRNGPVADVGATFEQPRLGGHPSFKQQSSIDLSRTIEQTYDNLGGRLAAGVVWQPRARVSIFPAYHLEVDYLNGSPINSAATAPLTLGCQTTTGSCVVVLSYLEEVVTWDHRDKPLEPRNGFYASLSLQEGGGPLQGDFGYFRVLPDLRAYVSFLDDNALTFAARLQVGELWPISGESAVVIRFYGGGANSMRGFSERRLSPLLEAPIPGTSPPAPGATQPTETVPIGGNGMFMGSFEARYSVLDNVRVAGFVDVGQVTTGLFSLGDLPSVLWAVGVGFRYLTPIGPIRLDLSRRLPFGTLPVLYTSTPAGIVPVSYAVDQSCFGFFAPHPDTVVSDGACTLQISIGEAF
jgi:translocation and assembly module TamA